MTELYHAKLNVSWHADHEELRESLWHWMSQHVGAPGYTWMVQLGKPQESITVITFCFEDHAKVMLSWTHD